MELTGKILEIQDEQQISAKFRKRSMILEVPDDRFTQVYEVEFKQDRGSLLDKWSAGQQVLVSVNLKGRKWDGPKGTRYFTSLEGWRIQAANAGGDSYPAPGGAGQGPAAGDDDIPF